MSNSHFSKFPQINLPRSRMKITFNHKLSMMHGYLTPIDCWPVVPGDSWDTKKIASLVHMSTPIVPFMDNIDWYYRTFFIPLRLLWSNFEIFMGANKGAGYQTVTPVFPAMGLGETTLSRNASGMRLSLSHLLGKPIQTFGSTGQGRILPKPFSVLKERGYYLIWNSYFRAEQLQGEYPIDFGDGWLANNVSRARVLLTDSAVGSSPNMTWDHQLLKVNKKHDYFVSATLSPQYGPSTQLPLGTYAPVVGQVTSPSTGATSAYSTITPNIAAISDVETETGEVGFTAGSSTVTGKLLVDLSQATAASINSLRFAFAVQRYLERSNYGSNHFYEILAVHYGVTSPDARLQRPEYLGGFHFRVNVDQVLNATGKTDTDQTQLGQKGAVSVTADRHFGFTKGFVEPGFIYVLAYTKQDRSYSTMVLREDIKTNRFEFYSPEFANLGDQEVYRFEIDGRHTNDDIFGYQEAWAEYRYRPSRVSGDLNPSVTGSMPYWTLADDYSQTGVPQLGPTWIQEDRDAVARALATGVNGPDFLVDVYIESVATRLMPVYSIPGLIDHVGSM